MGDRELRGGFFGSLRGAAGGQAAYVVLLALATLVLIPLSKLVSPALGGWGMVSAVLVIASMLAVVGFGEGVVILVGELDFSIAPVVALGGVLSARWLSGLGAGSTVLAIIEILGITGMIGLASGLGVTYLRVPSFIMTLGVQLIVAGATLGFTKGTTAGQTPDFLVNLMSGEWFSIPIPVFLIIVMAIVGTVIQQYTGFGRRLYAVGSNRATAHIAGVRVKWVIVGAFVVSAMCAGLTGMLLCGFSSGATLNMGDPYLLSAIAVVVVGGSSILGGRGIYLGTVVAAIFLTTISTIVQALGIAQGWQTFIYGVFIVAVIGLFKKDLYVLVGRMFRRRKWGEAGEEAVSTSE
jgi:ribose transport system permease protein